jgi:DNA-3-methyladenine glycosylase II
MTPAQSHLIAAEPAFAPLIARIGRPTLRPERGRSPYEALLRAITHQQLHARAAEAILARFCALYPAPFPAPADVIATPDAPLRACGHPSHPRIHARIHARGYRSRTRLSASS